MAILNSFPAVGGKDISSATITLTNSSHIYDGQAKFQQVSSVTYGGNTLEYGEDYVISGDSAVNAGTHTLKVIGVNEYSGEKDVSWTIAKGQGYVSADPTEVQILVGGSNTSTLTIVGDGTVSVTSSAPSVISASISDDVVTMTALDDGNATITVTLATGTNYLGASCTISVSIQNADPVLANNTPAQIQAVARSGVASTIWSVGDKTAPITISTTSALPNFTPGTAICAFILGFDHNSTYEGTGIHFQLGKTTSGTNVAYVDSGYSASFSSGTYFNMNNTNTNSGGWKSSRIRTVVIPAFISAMPFEWQNVLADTTKYTDNTGNATTAASNVTSTIDKLFLLAEYEIFGVRSYANAAEQNYQAQYQYYKNGNSKVRYRHNATSTTCNWLLRSVPVASSSYIILVDTSGANGGGSGWNAYYSRGFAPAFRVA